MLKSISHSTIFQRVIFRSRINDMGLQCRIQTDDDLASPLALDTRAQIAIFVYVFDPNEFTTGQLRKSRSQNICKARIVSRPLSENLTEVAGRKSADCRSTYGPSQSFPITLPRNTLRHFVRVRTACATIGLFPGSV